MSTKSAMRTLLFAGLFILVLFTQGCHSAKPDRCQRAYERIARIDARRGQPSMSKQATHEGVEQCRQGRYARHDPVLRCALDSPTDDAAAACIDKVVNRTLEPAATGKGGAGGKGINPLLQKHGTKP